MSEELYRKRLIFEKMIQPLMNVAGQICEREKVGFFSVTFMGTREDGRSEFSYVCMPSSNEERARIAALLEVCKSAMVRVSKPETANEA